MPAAQHLMTSTGRLMPPGFLSKPGEDSTDGGSCCSDVDASSSAAGGSSCMESLPAANPEIPGHEVPVVRDSSTENFGNKPRGCKGKGKSRGNETPVSSLRSALRSQGNQIMHDLMPKAGQMTHKTKPGRHNSPDMAITSTVPTPSFRPPPGLEDVDTNQQGMPHAAGAIRGLPGVWHLQPAAWTTSEEAGMYPCWTSTYLNVAGLEKHGTYFSL
eukprot:TRINITY_DN35555_c0_g1_i1.p1 TRINITY_DN35555_c0_g1~~TRINITY_DN35555_c0_g1_i1.p1  ORF type:complete len:215 (-),score=36.92 TRINITY_DN35555_c0_g1_i1:113-757(-)